jgi:adenine-specific DNA methylase
MLDFIEETIDEIDSEKGGVCDLFSGSGSVSFHLGQSREIVSVDIQEYSKVICSAILQKRNLDSDFLKKFLTKCQNSPHTSRLFKALDPLIKHEELAIQKALDKTCLEDLCEIIEKGSIISFQLLHEPKVESALEKNIRKVLINIESECISEIDSLAVRYFGGVYFSYKQTCQIDAILYQVNKAPAELKNFLLAPLLSTISDAVNTVGKQFAQPIRPRNNKGRIKLSLGKAANKDRRIDILESYKAWLNKYVSLPEPKYNHRVLNVDYKDALKRLPRNVSVVYADPPYTRDHYSRFYHVLETICLRDLPKISTMVSKGVTKLSRGLYREKRHQSPFCIRSQAPKAFRNLFSELSSKNLKLVLSYSPYDDNKETHPRVVKMDFLIDLAQEYFNHVEVKSVGEFTHSKLNNTAKHLDASKMAEVLIVCS